MNTLLALPSTAWVYANFILLRDPHVGLFSIEAQDLVWAVDTDALVAAGYMPTGAATKFDRGAFVSGTWRCVERNRDDMQPGACLVGGWSTLMGRLWTKVFSCCRATAIKLTANWQVVGLAGTGRQKCASAKDIRA